MLLKIRGKSLVSLRSPSPSPIALPSCFIQDVLPNPPSPFINFILVEIHKLLIGTWYIPSTAVPDSVQASFVILCACSAESYVATPATMSLS